MCQWFNKTDAKHKEETQDSDSGLLFNQHLVVNSCLKGDCLPVGRSDRRFASPPVSALLYRRAYTTAATFTISSPNASAVTQSYLLTFSANHSISKPPSPSHRHGSIRAPVSAGPAINWLELQRVGKRLMSLFWVIIAWSKEPTAAIRACSGIYSFHCLQNRQVFCFMLAGRHERGREDIY